MTFGTIVELVGHAERLGLGVLLVLRVRGPEHGRDSLRPERITPTPTRRTPAHVFQGPRDDRRS